MKYLFFISLLYLILSSNLKANDRLLPILEKKKVGYIDSTGKVIITPQFDTEIPIIDYINDKDYYPIPDFPENIYFSEGLAFNQKYYRIFYSKIPLWKYNYIIDTSGATIFGDLYISNDFYKMSDLIDEIFQVPNEIYNGSMSRMKGYIGSYSNGLIVAEKNSIYVYKGDSKSNRTYFNRSGQQEFGVQFDDAFAFSDGIGLVIDNETYYFIDSIGNILFNRKGYRYASSFSCDRAILSDDLQKFGYMDKTGKVVIPQIYDRVFRFSNQVARVYNNNIFFYIDKNNNKLHNREFEEAYDYIDECALVKENGKYGFIDKKGNFIDEPKYLQAFGFSEGLGLIKEDNKWFYIDKNGKKYFPNGFDCALPFRNGAALVYIDGKLSYINKKGQVIYLFNHKEFKIKK